METQTKTQVTEGTFEDVQRIFCSLPLSPEVRLQLTITEDESAPNQKACSLEELLLSNAPRRNGRILVPTKQRDVQVTLKKVREMSEDEY